MSEFHKGIAEILEIDETAVNSATDLHACDAEWDSLAVVSTIALIDDCFNVMLDGQSLTNCKTVGDIEAMIEAARKA